MKPTNNPRAATTIPPAPTTATPTRQPTNHPPRPPPAKQPETEPEEQGSLPGIHPQQRLREQLQINERHHQRPTGGQTGRQRSQKRQHPNPGRIQQPVPSPSLPHHKSHQHNPSGHQRGHAPRRQHRLIGIRVVQADDHQRQHAGQQRPTNEVRPLPGNPPPSRHSHLHHDHRHNLTARSPRKSPASSPKQPAPPRTTARAHYPVPERHPPAPTRQSAEQAATDHPPEPTSPAAAHPRKFPARSARPPAR